MDSPNTNLFELQIDASSQMYLRETAKWAKFLAILGFVICGLLVLGGIFAGTLMSTMSSQFPSPMPSGIGVMATFFYILFAVIVFFPYLFLFRFANQMLAALRSNDQPSLNSSFRNLKSHYKFVGILTIIILSFYLIFFIFLGLGMMAGAGSR